ncbi:GGDEF domain-containing protein [Corticibacter populi]|nr:GGDEF domain-containing protein [Corticibacter populi]RZS31043.1 diguanylate cyclase [Corticibacter populi]
MTSLPSPHEAPTPEGAWSEWLRQASSDSGELLAQIAKAPLHAYSDHFYAALFEDARAARFLSSEQVKNHLKPSLQRWLADLLLAQPDDTARLAAVNRHVGIAHARIGIPVDLVTRGFRELRLRLQQHIAELAGANAALQAAATARCNISMDIALEVMTQAYTKANEQSSHTDTAYRLFSLMQNMGTERERQRALLLDWENNLLYAMTSDGIGSAIHTQPLAASEFCLWLLHKGIPSLGESPESSRILSLIGEIDALLKDPAQSAPGASRLGTLRAIRERLDSIRSLLTTLFERVGELDAGSDALTNLLNRRFLPTVLRREIELAARSTSGFAIALLDLDHFKDINDRHGHETGDRALQFVAETLTRHTRGSDYVFRLGGEEFIVVLGSVSAAQARTIAEALRQHISATPLPAGANQAITITVSIGVAAYDGHPDYMRMISRADAAMYAAKSAGRNRVVMAATESVSRRQHQLDELVNEGVVEPGQPLRP